MQIKRKFRLTKETRRKAELSVLCGLLIAGLLSVTSFGAVCGQVREDVLRMHVIANSDSEADQAVKLKVRDAVLEAGGALFDGSMTVEDAQQVLQSDIDRLQNAAEEVLAEYGMDYGVTVEIGQDFFATRTYDDAVTLPAGVYTAVRVILGNGEGQNWWCVMFPPLCLPAAEGEATLDDALTDAEEDVVTRSPRFEARFKIVELFEKIAEKIR